MTQRLTLGSTEPIPFGLASAADHRTPMLGLAPVVLVSKATGPFGPPAGVVSEVGHGQYQLTPAPADTNTVGPLLLHATAPGCDPADLRAEVVARESDEILPAGSTAYPLTFLLVSSADHVTGAPGLLGSLAVTLRKPGGTYAAPDPAGTPVEVGYGLYALWPSAADTDTPGPLSLHAEAPGCDAADETFDVGPAAGPVPSAGAPAGDLVAALVAFARTDAGLRAALGSRTFRTVPRVPARTPYLVVREISAVEVGATFAGRETERRRVQFSAFAATEASAVRALAAVRAAFDPFAPDGSVRPKLQFAGGREVVAVPAGEVRLTELGRGAGVRTLIHRAQDYFFTVEEA